MYNEKRERRRKEMANQYVRYQCSVLYEQLCGECVTIELSEKEKTEMISRARKPIPDFESKRVVKKEAGVHKKL